MKSEEKLTAGCLKHNRKAQKALYEKYAPEMMTVCLRYCGDKPTAKDVMQEGFIRVYQHIGQLKDPTKLKAWIKQTMVNTVLMKMRKKESLVFCSDEVLDTFQEIEVFADETYQYSDNDLKQIFSEMPKGFKVIFNMYVFDDFSHQEIADTLNISINTSKSQLSRARAYLRKKLNAIKSDYYAQPKTLGLIGSMLWIYNHIF
ncbi:MAG: sigma-70 family RNA polymerase sigma factor [Bacteroidales bacterium]|nr:sigma-70 family RNA polymerase sigma factor [Bacteroidales bacterium]